MSRAGQGRAVLSWILSLPAPVLRLLSGGSATYREGRTLDPRLQFMAAGARRGRPMSAMTPEEARRSSAASAVSSVHVMFLPDVRDRPWMLMDEPFMAWKP